METVIGDVHARSEALGALLTAVGALDEHGQRTRGFWIVQLGDLLGRRAGEHANLATARLAASAIDIVLAGNHEARMLADVEGVGSAALGTLAARGWPHAAAALGDWLITHAGVHPKLAGSCDSRRRSARRRLTTARATAVPRARVVIGCLTGSDRPGEGKLPTAESSGPTRSNGAARARRHGGRSSDMSRNLSRGCCPGAGGRSTSAPAMGASSRSYEHQASGDGSRWSLTRPQGARQSSRASVLERPPEQSARPSASARDLAPAVRLVPAAAFKPPLAGW